MKCNYKLFAQKSIQFYPCSCLCARIVQNSASRGSMKTITSKTALFSPSTIPRFIAFHQNNQLLSKHVMCKFFKNIHGLFLSQATCLQLSASMLIISIIFATTSQNFMVFQIRGHRFSIFGSSISAIFFRVNHPKLLHVKRNSFKTTIIPMPYLLSKQSTTFQNKYVMGKFFKNIHGLFLSQATRQFPCQPVIVATTSQNFMVFIKYLVTVFHFGSSISAIFFRVNHPKLLHVKRDSFKTTIISSSMPYQKQINYLSIKTTNYL
jgi:hypothetical protein